MLSLHKFKYPKITILIIIIFAAYIIFSNANIGNFFFGLSLKDEFLRLSRNSILVKGEAIIKKSLSKYIKIYLLYALIGLVISSPLPDEIGILMLAGLTRVKLDKLIILSFLLNTIGIFILLNL